MMPVLGHELFIEMAGMPEMCLSGTVDCAAAQRTSIFAP